MRRIHTDLSSGGPLLIARLLNVAEAAEILNISLRSVRRLIAEKKLRVVRIGRAVRIHPEALADLMGD